MSAPLKRPAFGNAISEATAAALPAIIMDARRAAASIVIGEHGKRRAGIGEAFWQYREWANGESVRQIDWRRSARSEKVFIRERERQVPALMQIWCDARADMDWAGAPARPTKFQSALMLALSIAIATRNGGERVVALGEGAPFRDELGFAHALSGSGSEFPLRAKAGQVLVLSDGLEPAETWAARAKLIASARANLQVVLVCDPDEATFPFQGRTEFQAPSSQTKITIGRAQAAQSDYLSAYRNHFDAVRQAVHSNGGQVHIHQTSAPTGPLLLALSKALGNAAPMLSAN